MKQILWTKKIVDTFIKEGMLTKEEREVLLLRVQGYLYNANLTIKRV